MDRFWRYTKHYMWKFKWWYIIGVFFIAATQALAVGIIESVKGAINAMDQSGISADTITPYSVTIAVLAILLMIIRTFSRHLFFTPGRMIEYDIRNDYFSKLVFLQRNFFSAHETGDLVSRCTHDITFIRSVYGFAVMQIANVTMAFTAGIGAMLIMDAKTTMFLAIPMIVSFTIIQLSISFMFQYWRKANRQLGELSSFCFASYKGVSVIQSYHAEPVFQGKFAEQNNDYLQTNLTVNAVRCFAMPLIQTVGALSLFIILWVVGPKVIDKQLKLGDITAFIGYVAMVMPPLMSLGWMLNVLNRALPAMERLDDVLLAEPDLLEAKADLTNFSAKGSLLEAKNLNFAHNREKDSDKPPFIINNVNFTLKAGSVMGIVGETGSGKTTLAETIIRLNALEPEQLFINGVDAAYTDLRKYREYFAVVPQTAFLFSTTLRNNLRISLPNAEWDSSDLDNKLIEYLELAGFYLDSQQLPEGLDTLVGEKGVMLSGGQRQRVALARALLKNADIYILDDVLSAVDHETESLIIGNLQKFAADKNHPKSFIIISHRVSAVQWANNILVMQNGQVIDSGDHQSLVERPGYYQEIYTYQRQHDGST